jgi:uncharacterized protein with von Willebrand factor type A (vWA) domain
MFLQFFTSLRDAQVPVTLREYLTLMEALDADLADQTVENFYYLSRAALVKDERNLDKFDRVFGSVFKGLESLLDAMEKADIPAEWLKKLAEKYLTEEEKKQIEAMGWDKLMETLRQRLKEQQGRHQGGNKWIGTAGTSPFGAHGYNPEGVRIGQEKNRNNRAVKVWDKREFKDLDGNVELGIRNIKIALRRCANSPAPARPTNSISTPRSGKPPTTAISTCHAARAAQRGQGAGVLRHRRLDGFAYRAGRGAVLGGEVRVQAHGVFLLPQLPL